MCTDVFACMYICVSVLEPMELELQLSASMWVLVIEPRYSGGIVSTLNR